MARNLAWATSDFEVFSHDDENGVGNEVPNQSRLNVLHPDSPYGLIQHVISPTLPKSKPIGNDRVSDLGGLSPDDIWLSEGNLLVLKGGTTPFVTNHVQEPEKTYSHSGSQVNEAFNGEDHVTYSDSGKLAIAPAPPQIASIYVNNLNPTSNVNIDKIRSIHSQARVPKHIGNAELVPFVPKNTQIPWPKTQHTGIKNVRSKLTSNDGLQPIQNTFKPSKQIYPGNVYIPKINQYTASHKNPIHYGAPINLRHQVNSPGHHSPSNLVIRSTVSPLHTAGPKWIPSSVLSPATGSLSNTYSNNNNNRKSYSHTEAMLRQNHPRHRASVNPVIEYLKQYSLQNKKPSYQKIHLNGARRTQIQPSLNKGRHRMPKAYNKLRKEIVSYHHKNNYDYLKTPSVKESTPKIFRTPQTFLDHSTNYIKKKTRFLDYLTNLKPYLPQVL